jgi:hypothetical protein
MKATLALGLIFIIAQAHAHSDGREFKPRRPAYPCPLERSVPAMRTDCRTPFRARIYDACMARFWRNAGIYYSCSALPYFRLCDWPPLVAVEQECVNEAMGLLSPPW